MSTFNTAQEVLEGLSEPVPGPEFGPEDYDSDGDLDAEAKADGYLTVLTRALNQRAPAHTVHVGATPMGVTVTIAVPFGEDHAGCMSRAGASGIPEDPDNYDDPVLFAYASAFTMACEGFGMEVDDTEEAGLTAAPSTC